MNNPSLQVLIVTVAANAPAIQPDNYPPVPGVAYIFSVQNPGGHPFHAPLWMTHRPDVSCIVTTDTGICRNRNNAIDAATAPLILMADDDLVYHPDDLRRLIDEYAARPDADYILWHADTPSVRRMPPSGTRFTSWPPYYSPISIEFSFRTDAYRRNALRWNEKAGIGAELLVCGEEELMFRDLLASPLTGYYIDARIATHPGPTTSRRKAATRGFVITKGALLRACRGPLGGLIRIPVEALRSQAPIHRAIPWLLRGYLYAPKLNQRPKD